MSKPPLGALQAFVLAAQQRNLSHAAQRLNLTVSALSHQIRALEQRLQRTLFVRGPRGVSLTEDGERLLDAVAGPLQAIERALQPPRQCREGVLALSTLPTIATGWLVPRLPRFVARHPELELHLHSGSGLVDFSKEPVDAALRFGPGAWPGLEAIHLFDEWVTPVASPAFLKRRPRRPGPAELARWPLLGDPGGRWRDWFAQFGGAEPRRYVANFDDSESLHRAALEGLGVALGRLTLVKPLLDAGRLVALMPQRLRAEWSHYLVYPPRSAQHAGVAAFRAWVLEEAAQHSAATAALAAGAAPARKRRR
ncbi:LysR substrate-binding domain-containing protein [Tahibacter harae]|uniref:LysR substrate-binding domain-containing protein n=1 Tax=Tahibacter harae TaxID=2963937 RepID=A0ABT1QTJ8_9GAMM|nr:LysR substrate-binding domain-containing protein [Tahibacter harae]MCQ4165603.1 LysR substrate-binding domain-containing protein [Tahibacter harae]